MKDLSTKLLRFSWAAMFLWFGFNQLLNPAAWVIFLPTWTGYFPIPGGMLVQLNGWLEIVSAVALIIGVWVKPIAIFLGLHLTGIAISVGGATGVRDAVLAVMGFALAAAPADEWSLETMNK